MHLDHARAVLGLSANEPPVLGRALLAPVVANPNRFGRSKSLAQFALATPIGGESRRCRPLSPCGDLSAPRRIHRQIGDYWELTWTRTNTSD
jgi:hypothetical protein